MAGYSVFNLAEVGKDQYEAGACYWYGKEDDKHEAIFSHVRRVEEDQRYIRKRNIAHAQLYSNRYEPGFRDMEQDHSRSGYTAITDNLIQSVVDTATSLIGNSKVKATILTEGADWDTYALAENVEQFLWGMFQGLNIHRKMAMVFRDASVFGTGCLRILNLRNKEIRAERVLIDDIVVDEGSVYPGCELPQQLHHVRYVSKEVLKARWPEHKEKIDEADCAHRMPTDPRIAGDDCVLFIESYHRASGPGAGDGRYCASLSTVTLVDEEYEYDHYPYVFFHFDAPTTGFYGKGLAETLLGHQIRLNQLHDHKRRAQDLICTPRVALEHSSSVFEPQITNEIAALIYYTGTPPQFLNPPAVSPEMYDEETRIKQSALELAGISRMSAYAARPEGVEAGVAMRELTDSQTKRHLDRQSRFEEAFLDVAKLIIACAREVFKGNKNPPPCYVDAEIIKEIDWERLDFNKSNFVMQVAASSVMSETPAGRLSRATELLQYGKEYITPIEFRRMLGHPDIGMADKVATSPLDDIQWTIRQMHKGIRMRPEAFQDLELGVEYVTAAYLQAKRRKAQPRIQECLRDWVTEAMETLKQREAEQMAMMAQQQQQAQMAGGMPADPMMAGAAPVDPMAAPMPEQQALPQAA